MNIQTFVQQLIEHCGVESDQVTVDTQETDDQLIITVTVPSEDSGLFIGHRGETILALQRVIRGIFQSTVEDKKIHLNINEYREQRQNRLEEIAHNAATKVLQTGRPYTFHTFFSGQERFFIHAYITSQPEFAELESVSFGEGVDRRLTIQFKSEQDQDAE